MERCAKTGGLGYNIANIFRTAFRSQNPASATAVVWMWKVEGRRKRERDRERRGGGGAGVRGAADVLRNSQTIQPMISWDEVKGIPNHCLMTGNTVRTPKALAPPATRALLAMLALGRHGIPVSKIHNTESDDDYIMIIILATIRSK